VSDRSEAVDAWEALYRAQVTVLRRLRTVFPDDDISVSEYDVLFNLSRLPGHAARIRDLNRRLLLTQPSVSRLLDRIAARGFVTKSDDPRDARGTIVTLTEAGYEIFRRVGSRHAAAIAELMTCALDDDELRELARLTDKLRHGVDPQ
jgi:DNA-binding MarR family transcriptional regulator